MLTLTHTSPEKIESINKNGMFGSGLFFSHNQYWMGHGDNGSVYTIEIEESQIWDMNHFYYNATQEELAKIAGVIERVSKIYDCDSDQAFEYLLERENYDGEDDDGFKQLKIQALALDAALILGFRGVRLYDEQGTAFLIDMFGRENDLKEL